VTGQGSAFSGNAVLHRSTVEGATLSDGTAAEFKTGPDGISYAARGTVEGLNVQRVGRAMHIAALDKPAYEGTLNGDFDVKGEMPPARRGAAAESRTAAMTLDATGTLRDSTIMGGRLPQLAYETHLAGGALEARANGRFEGFDPAALANRKEIGGEVTGTMNVDLRVADISAPITPDSITATGAVALERSRVGGLEIETASVDGRYAAQVADLKRLQVNGPDLKVDASGQVALDRTSASNLKYHVEAVDLAELGKLAGQAAVGGAAVLDGTITGNAASLTTTGTIDGSNVGYGENKALDLNSKYSVTLTDLDVKKARVEADTTASFVKAGGLQLNAVTARTTFAGDRLQFTTNIKEQKRELDATGEVILHTDHQEIHLPQLAVRTQGVEWRSAPGAEATVKYGEERVEVDNMRLVSGDQALTVDGTFALKGDSPAGEVKVQATNVDLQQLETLMLMDRGLTGRLSADATISGTAKDPAIDGHVDIVNGGFQTYKYQSLKADVDYNGDRIGLDATLQQSPTEAITARGSVPTSLFRPGPGGHVAETTQDHVDLHVKSTALNLGIIQGFTNQVTNVAGTLEADVRVTGSGQDPHVQGYVDIKGGAFGIPAGGVSYSGLNTRIDLEQDKVRLQKFAILDEHGQPLNVSGELAVHARQVGAVNISIDSDNFEVIDNELGDVGIDSTLSITGELRRPQIRGTIRLEAARLEVDRILQLFYDPYSVEELPPVVSAERTVEGSGSAEDATSAALKRAETTAAVPGTKAQAEAGTAPAPTGAFAPVELDLRLRVPDNLVLRGKKLRPGGPTGASLGDMNITVGGDLQIVKPANGQVLLLGTVETVRGTYEFQGRRFDLQRGGTLRFLGEAQPNPALDVTATRVIPNTGVEARVRIQGTAKAPQLSLTSTPPLEESDILALIVFNRPVNELGSGERASLAATAGGIATGFIAAPLGESIGRALDLDLFEITTTTEEGDLGAGLTLGQQIGDRAFFKMRQQFGERNVTEFLLEYQLFDFLRLQTTAAPETTGSANRIGQRRIERAGIDLIFFFSY
jgi:translocation and assembly module TamB